MKLEVGMYVRTKKGIAKVKKLDDLDNVAWTDNKNIFFGIKRPSGKLYFELYDDGTVLKASHNIIDLIEVGDYVNGYKITTINEMTPIVYAEDEQGYLIKIIPKEDIKTIVTKEQFEAMAYKVV